MTVMDYEHWFKLLMCANRLGIYITDAHGHNRARGRKDWAVLHRIRTWQWIRRHD